MVRKIASSQWKVTSKKYQVSNKICVDSSQFVPRLCLYLQQKQEQKLLNYIFNYCSILLNFQSHSPKGTAITITVHWLTYTKWRTDKCNIKKELWWTWELKCKKNYNKRKKSQKNLKRWQMKIKKKLNIAMRKSWNYGDIKTTNFNETNETVMQNSDAIKSKENMK